MYRIQVNLHAYLSILIWWHVLAELGYSLIEKQSTCVNLICIYIVMGAWPGRGELLTHKHRTRMNHLCIAIGLDIVGGRDICFQIMHLLLPA
jgi:hypothetical protein